MAGIRIKTMKQIATSRTIRGFRSCNSVLGAWSDFAYDQARITADRAQILANEVRRQVTPPERAVNPRKHKPKRPPSATDKRRLVKIILASSYFCRELPPNYHRRRCVSQLSSRWISVVPHRHRHQE